MAAIRPIDSSSDKWVRRSSVAAPDYTQGVENPRRPWADAAAAADQNYRQGVTQAAQAGRFGQGVRAAGNDKWRNAAISKGPNRFTEGVSLARDEWESGFRPFQDAIAALSLPARGPKGSPQNIQRVSAVANTMRQLFERRGTGRSGG